MQPPTINVLTPTTMEISWLLPIQANGKLTSYIIRLPNPRFEIYNTSVMYLYVEDLVPFTQYNVTVTACSGQLM